ncbi:MAG: methionine biosynthesis protein MetW [Verrucomicrobiota bacterium JB022]|nr:methionine biosynthesis protein MetW [Verrucomicrobiota bacterium JB022]
MPPRQQIKRETEQSILSDWIQPEQRVLDVGCGRGILLEHLTRTKQVYGVGVDSDLEKVASCVKRSVNVYMGDAEAFLSYQPAGAFDWVVMSRTVQELDQPGKVIAECLRVAGSMAIGFVNFGYWRNRLDIVRHSRHGVSDVFPRAWEEDWRHNQISVEEFERFCARQGYNIRQAVYLRGDWKTPCRVLTGWRAGYALYWLERK